MTPLPLRIAAGRTLAVRTAVVAGLAAAVALLSAGSIAGLDGGRAGAAGGGLLVAPAWADDEKPYHIAADGTVSWAVFSGFRRYHSECHVCHGPGGSGSSFAPALVDSLKKIDHDQFMEIVVNGRQNVGTAADKVMPPFGTNRNVMCYIDDIYAYLKARSDGVIERGRPDKHEDKPQDAAEAEKACMD